MTKSGTWSVSVLVTWQRPYLRHQGPVSNKQIQHKQQISVRYVFIYFWFLRRRADSPRVTWKYSLKCRHIRHVLTRTGCESPLYRVGSEALNIVISRLRNSKELTDPIIHFLVFLYFVGFEDLTAVVMKSSFFSNITPCILLKINRRFDWLASRFALFSCLA
jgi:hypothetical protein